MTRSEEERRVVDSFIGKNDVSTSEQRWQEEEELHGRIYEAAADRLIQPLFDEIRALQPLSF